MPGSMGSLSPSATLLGIGSGSDMAGGAGVSLKQQTQEQIEEEKRRKKLGLSSVSPAVQQLMGFGL